MTDNIDIMRTNILKMFAFMAILCLASIATFAFIRKYDGSDFVMTSLWKEYDAAQKADRPETALSVLDRIMVKAREERLHYDFYTAACNKLTVETSRDWKKNEEWRQWLDRKIEEYDEPIVTFCHKVDNHAADLSADYVLVNKTKLQAGRNCAFYGRCGAFSFPSVWTGFFRDDYEFALWACLNGRVSDSGKAVKALEEHTGDIYPNSAFLEYSKFGGILASGGWRNADNRNAAREFVLKYKGRAMSLYGKSMLLRWQYDSLDRDRNSTQDDFKALYAECRAAEKERASYTSGADARLASDFTMIKSLVETLESKTIKISYEGRTARIALRNLGGVAVEFALDAKGAKPLVKRTIPNPRKSFYLPDTLTLEIPKCDDGKYILTAKNGKVEKKGIWNQNTLSVATRSDGGGSRFFVADCFTGEPVPKATLELFDSGKSVAKVEDVPVDGFTPLPDAIAGKVSQGSFKYLVASCRGDDGLLRKSDEHLLYLNPNIKGNDEKEESFCGIFTDRSAYRPGETICFKAVVYEGSMVSGLAVSGRGKEVKAELLDTEDKTVAEADLLTNEYGSVAGRFDIPEGGRNGTFRLRIQGDGVRAEKTLKVDEFMLPSYDLSFEPESGPVFSGDTAVVKGRVFSFSGHPLSAARVSYSVERFGKVISEGSLHPGSDGSFSFGFPTENQVGCYRNIYTATVKVTDATGETREFARRVLAVDAFSIGLDLKNAFAGSFTTAGKKSEYSENIVSGPVARIEFSLNGSSETFRSCLQSEIEYVLKDASGKEVLSGKSSVGEIKDIPLSAPGLYTLEAGTEITTKSGLTRTGKGRMSVLRLDRSAERLDARIENVFVPVGSCADGLLKTGEDIRIQFGAGDGPVWALVELFGDNSQLLDSRLVHLEGKAGEAGSLVDITYNYKEEYPDGLYCSIFYFRNSRQYSYSRSFRRERDSLEIPLAFSSFTGKTLPGKECSLVLKSVPGVEAVAAVFDKSTETVAGNDWRSVRLNVLPVAIVNVRATAGGISTAEPFGDIMIGYSGAKNRRLRVRALSSVAADTEDALVLAESSPDNGSFDLNASSEEVYVSKAVTQDMLAQAGDVPDVKVRSDFAATLAFEPFLHSDDGGRIFLNFKTSDKLSTFVVQVWAHTPQMKNACVRQEMVVSVPVKVSVSEPGYLYRGDRLVLHATVSNGSGKTVSGSASLQAYSSADCKDSKPFASRSVKVTVPAGESVPVEFEVDPKKYDEIGLKVVFADDAGTFSDGVFVSLPVREAAQTLTESHSAVLLAGADRDALVRRLEGEFTGTTSRGAELKEIDVRRMVLDALPSKVEPDGKDVLSLTEALYVRRVAASLGAEIVTEMDDETLIGKIKACINEGGGMGWFEGMRPSPVVTAVVLERFAKMRDAGLDFGGIDLAGSVSWLDRNQFVHGDSWPLWCGWLSAAQYVHVRSMYPSVPFDVSRETRNEKSEYNANFKAFKKYVKDYLVPSEKDGRGLDGQILAKARRIGTLSNLVNGDGGLALASSWGLKFDASPRMNGSLGADVLSLLEYAVRHQDGGRYFPNAVMPWRGLLESELYAHSLLCDLLDSVASSSAYASVDVKQRRKAAETAGGIRLWLMLQKETQKWGDDPAFADAVNSVLSGSEDLLSTKVISLTKTYTAPFRKISAAGNGFSIERHFYKEVKGRDGETGRLEIFPGTQLHVGDRVTAEYRIWSQENRSFVRLIAPREAAFRPVDQLSGNYGWWLRPLSVSNVWAVTPQGYRDVKTDRTEYWFDVYPEEKTTVFEDFYVTQEGTFSAPVVTVESLYAPHYRANAAFVTELKTIK
jgi:hypothetical protein